MKSCLIVIDAQVSFRHRDYFTNADLPAYLSAQNQLIAGAWEQAIPIIRIFHCDGPAITSNPWSKESGYLIDLCFVILPDTLLMDWAGPAEAFRIANQRLVAQALEARFNLRFVGPLAEASTSVGLQVSGLEPLPKSLCWRIGAALMTPSSLLSCKLATIGIRPCTECRMRSACTDPRNIGHPSVGAGRL